MKKLLTLVLFALYLIPALACAEIYGSGWYQEVQVSVGRESNVPRAYDDRDRISDVFTTGSFGIGYLQKVGDTLEFAAGGYASYRHHEDIEALSSTSLALNGSLIWQPSPGWQRPWLQFSGEIARVSTRNSDPRDGYAFTADVSANKRIGMRSVGRVGYSFVNFNPDGGIDPTNGQAAFDIERHEVFAGADILIANNLWLVVELAYLDGDLTASSTDSATATGYAARIRDPAFDFCNGSQCTPYYAYRFPTRTRQLDMGLAFSAWDTDFDLSVLLINARGKDGLTYRDRIAQIGAIWTF